MIDYGYLGVAVTSTYARAAAHQRLPQRVAA